MLRRLISIVVLLAIAGFIASFLQAQPGVTQIEWLGWRIEARTSLLIAIALVGVWLIVCFDRLLGYLVHLPGRISSGWSQRRNKQGNHALALGLIAASTGDGREALRQSKRAQRLIGDDTLTGLLSAQAAALTGDQAAAARYFETLGNERETAFLGKAGLMRLEIEDGRHEDALTTGRAAFALNNNAPSLAKALFILEAQHQHWPEAIAALEVARRDQSMKKQLVDASFAALYYSAAADQDSIKSLKSALKYDPGFTPAVLAAALHYEGQDKPRKQIKILEQGFANTPHPDVADALFMAWGGDEKALAKMIRFCAKHGNLTDGLLATARIAMGLQLWGEALRLLRLIPDEGQNISMWQMMADIADHAPDDAADWPTREDALMKAASAPRPSSWRCASCGAPHLEWSATCSACDSFAQVHYSA